MHFFRTEAESSLGQITLSIKSLPVTLKVSLTVGVNMDEFLNLLSSLTGLDEQGVLLLLGVVVAVANLVGKLIPDDATGFAALIRKVAKVLGIYVANRKSSYDSSIGSTVRSPAVVGAIALAVTALFISACTPFSIGLARAGTAAVCAGSAAAQAELDKMVANKQVSQAGQFLFDLQTYCPSIFLALDLREAQLAQVPIAPPPADSSHP